MSTRSPGARGPSLTVSPSDYARIVIPHEDLGADDFHEWITLHHGAKVDAWLRSAPRMTYARGERWICNNADCAALAFVLADDLGQHVLYQVEKGSRP